jgi:hypothetical protein
MQFKYPAQTIFSAVLLSLFLLPAYAAELTAERYVQIEIAAREAALAGARARLEQLSRSTSEQPAQALSELSEHTHQAVNQVYRQAGINPGAHLAWENRNRKAIRAWLESHPEIQQHYNALNDELDDLSDQIDASLGQ